MAWGLIVSALVVLSGPKGPIAIEGAVVTLRHTWEIPRVPSSSVAALGVVAGRVGGGPEQGGTGVGLGRGGLGGRGLAGLR
jgi:hypothetical protein